MVSRRLKTIVTILSVIWGLIGVISLAPAGLSVMIFDAPGSENQPGTVWLFRAVASFPLVCFFVSGLSFVLNRYDFRKLAIALLFLPFINIGIAIAALIAIDRIQGGKFGG